MQKFQLGKTGLEVTELSLGTLIFGWLQADMTPEQSAPAIAKALEMGINFFDTAQSYGTQPHLRLGLAESVNDVIIATKTHARTREEAQRAFEESLRELNREYIDVYQLHLIDSTADIAGRREVLDYILGLKEKGLVRATGASVHKVEGAKAVAAEADLDILFPVINAHGLGIPDGSVDEMIAVCKTAKEADMGIYVMKPLAGGHLRQTPKEAFQFIRDTGLAGSICVGMKSEYEVEMNVNLIEGQEISDEISAQIETITRSLKIYDRCSGCGSCVEACDQEALSLDYLQADESIGKEAQAVVDGEKCILCGYCAEVCPNFTIRVV